MGNITLTVASKVITVDLMPTLWSKDTFVTSGITLTGLSVKLKASDGRYANAGEGREIATDVTMTIAGGNGTATDMDFGTTEAIAAFTKTEPTYIWLGLWDVGNEEYLATGKVKMAWASKPAGATATSAGGTAVTATEAQALIDAVIIKTGATNGQSATYNSTTERYEPGDAGTGDFSGPASSTDNAVVRFDGTGGKTGQNSAVTVDDNGTVNIPAAQEYQIDGTALSSGDVGAEPALGNPAVDNYGLASTAAGVRSWAEHVYGAERAHEVHQSCRKGSAGTVAKLVPVYIDGYNPAGYVEVEACDADADATMPCFGITAESVGVGADGEVVMMGHVETADTSSFSVGDELYVASGGGLTATKPTGSTRIQKVAIVLRSHASLGVISVFGAGRVNDLPNYDQYSEKTTPVDADTVLIEDSAASDANKWLTWANIKATLKTYLDTLYTALNAGSALGNLGATPSNTVVDNGKYTGTVNLGITSWASLTLPANACCKIILANSGQTVATTGLTVIPGQSLADIATDGAWLYIENSGGTLYAKATAA